jgi:NADH-quinone oxidoreductase subunit E
LIAILQYAQENYRYLPKEVFPYLAEKLSISEAKIFGVATFYENFSLEQKGKYIIKVCDRTACHVRRSVPVLNELRKQLGLKEGQKTTSDNLFTVETVSCLGACGLAPVMMINETVYSAMTPEKVVGIINSIKEAENV